MHVPTEIWIIFAVVVGISLTVDLFAHRGDHVDSHKRAIAWSIAWIAVSLAFNVFVWFRFGAEAGQEFLSAYLLEKSLSVDNLFVFIMIFRGLGIPAAEQRRVLSWGIFGALLTRALFIAVGAAMLQRWSWVMYIFGAILIITSVKMVRSSGREVAPGEGRVLRWLQRSLPWTKSLHGHRFVTRVNGRRMATPLLLALLAVEMTDVIFAIDSIPAAFAVTNKPFLVYSSNIFAILGLRALYIVLAGALLQLRHLHYGLAAVLAVAGLKMILADVVHVPAIVSLAVIFISIGVAVLTSLHAARDESSGRPIDQPI